MSDNTVSETERWLIDALCRMGLKVSNPSSDFFEVGGTSLAAIRLIAMIEERYGEVVVTPEEFFERRTIEGLAVLIDELRTTSGPRPSDA